jgi:hypothetical protein
LGRNETCRAERCAFLSAAEAVDIEAAAERREHVYA